jgi:hypothetical protein
VARFGTCRVIEEVSTPPHFDVNTAGIGLTASDVRNLLQLGDLRNAHLHILRPERWEQRA